ncbi:MAG TPA: DUF3108 domain-containing protein [Prolixibacteraceae bacterium]|nr:DUF3108 domain-containing protein [Prolixibacteraceae bacterium]HPS13190.1 DUF3108 domain-containing protein [Prolixibacteraceae bacterium]
MENRNFKYLVLGLLLSFVLTVVAKNPTNETLGYTIRYGQIIGGKASISTTHREKDGKEMIFSEMKMQSTGSASSMFSINNTYSSYIDPVTFLPRKTIYKISEQDMQYDDEVTFFQEDGNLFSNELGWDEFNGKILDAVSMICNFRFSGQLNEMKPGEIFQFSYWDINEVYTLKMRYCGVEEIQTSMGNYSCLKIEPVQVKGKDAEKRMPFSVWITNNEQKLPVLIQFSMKVGSIRCELDSIKGEG